MRSALPPTLILAAGLTQGCGGYDSATMEKQIAEFLQRQGFEAARVSCPEGRKRQDGDFDCTATVDDVDFPVTVSWQKDRTFAYEYTGVFLVSKVVAELERRTTEAGESFEVSCEGSKVWIAVPDATHVCTLKNATGVHMRATLTMTDTSGNYRVELEPFTGATTD